jgi:hypothetical protein
MSQPQFEQSTSKYKSRALPLEKSIQCLQYKVNLKYTFDIKDRSKRKIKNK